MCCVNTERLYHQVEHLINKTKIRTWNIKNHGDDDDDHEQNVELSQSFVFGSMYFVAECTDIATKQKKK